MPTDIAIDPDFAARNADRIAAFQDLAQVHSADCVHQIIRLVHTVELYALPDEKLAVYTALADEAAKKLS
jgi:hypothetical protein